MMYYMNRRAFLVASGSWLTAGCSARRALVDGSGSPREYALGEWHAFDGWRVTVSSLDLGSTFRIDDAERAFEMPDGEQLAVATVRVENTADSRRGWAAGDFAVVAADGTAYDSRRAFDHPEFAHEVDVGDLRRVEHQEQFHASGLGVDAGETARLWVVAVLPAEETRERLAVGFDTPADDEVAYSIRWTPA